MRTVLWLLAIQGALGMFDTLCFHEWRARLPALSPQARPELRLHGVRSLIYTVLAIPETVSVRHELCHTAASILIGPLKEADMAQTLYKRLGGYDAIAAVADDLLPRLAADPQLGRFWKHRAEDSVRREKQLLVDFLSASAGGPLYYVGRDMKTSHRGMGINEQDWHVFLGHVNATLDHFKVPSQEKSEVLGFVDSLKKDIVE